MTGVRQRIEALDVSLFGMIPSQTSEADRRALLAIHRAVSKRDDQFVYMEIGSHLGGSIQPFLLDPRCVHVYSIDPRPRQQPDDREVGWMAHYPDNTTERMLEHLREVDYNAVRKVECFEVNTNRLERQMIERRPMISFIDGEHTYASALADGTFCLQVTAQKGVIVFHDFAIVHRAIRNVLNRLPQCHISFLVEGSVFAIFLDPSLVRSDQYLLERYRRHRYYHRWFPVRQALRRVAPGGFRRMLRGMRSGSGHAG